MKKKNCKFCKKIFIPRYRISQNFCDKICQEKYWVLNNKEHSNNYKHKWYSKNKQLTIQRAKEWTLKNPIKAKESKIKHFSNNRDKYNEKNRVWVINNPEKKKAQSKAQHFIVMNPICEMCGSTQSLQRHHWRYDKPLLVNTLCQSCHSIQHSKKPMEVSI